MLYAYSICFLLSGAATSVASAHASGKLMRVESSPNILKKDNPSQLSTRARKAASTRIGKKLPRTEFGPKTWIANSTQHLPSAESLLDGRHSSYMPAGTIFQQIETRNINDCPSKYHPPGCGNLLSGNSAKVCTAAKVHDSIDCTV